MGGGRTLVLSPCQDEFPHGWMGKGWREGTEGLAGEAGQVPGHLPYGVQGWGVDRAVCPLTFWFLVSYSLLFMVPVACGLFPQIWYWFFVIHFGLLNILSAASTCLLPKARETEQGGHQFLRTSAYQSKLWAS